MNDEALSRFAESLAREVDDARDDSSNSLPSVEGAFTRLVLEQLEEANQFADAFDLHQEGRLGRSTFRISGYSISEEAGWLLLFATRYFGEIPPRRLAVAELLRPVTQAVAYLAACVGGLAGRLEPSNTEAGDLARRVADLGPRLNHLKVVVLTDGVAVDRFPESVEIAGRQVELDLYDLVRLHRVLGQGETRSDIDVDLVAISGSKIRCLPVRIAGERYEAYLAAFPGEMLSRIYDRYGTRLLELNVRAFLGLAGRKSVNAELRKTLIERPEMFLAFNNGIVATVDEVRLEHEAGAAFMTGLKGLQIVNGGQTVASLHRAWRKDRAPLAAVEIPVKIIRVPAGDLEETVVSISRAANRQNTVQQADFSANSPFHLKVENLANNTWLDDGRGRWFYERARGSYLATEQKASFKKGELKAFRDQTPKSRRFGKLDLARCLSAWDGFPWRVAFGGQKNFEAYMQRQGDAAAKDLDTDWFKRLGALLILFRTVERVVRAERFPAYGANIVAYLVAALGHRTGGRIDFEVIWKQQRISAELEALIGSWAPVIDKMLRGSAGERNPTEWFKKEECWAGIRDQLRQLPALDDPLPRELAVHGNSMAGGQANVQLGAADYDRIEECMRVTAAEWVRAAEVGQRLGVLNHWIAGICMTLAGYASGGWTRRPSVKQARHGLEALAKVRDADEQTPD